MKKAMQKLKKFVSNPTVKLVVGLLFLYSGLSETWFELQEMEEFRVGAHHGVILLALFNISQTIPEFFEGLEYIEQSRGEPKPDA